MAYWMRACSRNTAGPWNRKRGKKGEKGRREGESVSKIEREFWAATHSLISIHILRSWSRKINVNGF